ncbi:MAG: hypothetical protein OEO23_09440 [Gemmatimonadota bacterium]|nr:hypothetical protein [Gemmatimonadota bacterium]
MRTRYAALAVLAAVFFAGIASTLAVLRVVEHRDRPAWEMRDRGFRDRPLPGARNGPGGLPELARMDISERLANRLGLTEDQRAQLDSIMERRRREAETLMQEFMPRLRSQTDALQREIEGVLTEEQQAIFREFTREGRERFRGRRPGPGSGPAAR